MLLRIPSIAISCRLTDFFHTVTGLWVIRGHVCKRTRGSPVVKSSSRTIVDPFLSPKYAWSPSRPSPHSTTSKKKTTGYCFYFDSMASYRRNNRYSGFVSERLTGCVVVFLPSCRRLVRFVVLAVVSLATFLSLHVVKFSDFMVLLLRAFFLSPRRRVQRLVYVRLVYVRLVHVRL